MIFGGCIFFAGGAINGAAENIATLILGRILLGLGVGFTNQVSNAQFINYMLQVGSNFNFHSPLGHLIHLLKFIGKLFLRMYQYVILLLVIHF